MSFKKTKRNDTANEKDCHSIFPAKIIFSQIDKLDCATDA